MTLSDMQAASTDNLIAIATRIRRRSLEATNAAGSGHPTSSMSCAEILAVLFFRLMRYDLARPEHPANDRFVLSKGHAAPGLWATLAEAGAISQEQLLSLRQIDSTIEGHPTPRNPYIDVPTGSLGQGLSVGLGMSLWSRHRHLDNRVWVLLGDGECAEGAVWEAAALADHYGAQRLCAIIDVNRLGQTGETMYGHDCTVYQERFKAFGWETIIADGHDIPSLIAALERARHNDGPCAIIARTVKGKGVGFLEHAHGRHGKPIEGEEYERALNELGEPETPQTAGPLPPDEPQPKALRIHHGPLPTPSFDGDTATRQAYGEALQAALGLDDRLLVFDAEVSNSTGSGRAAEAYPERYIECFIAEQNMIGMALGSAALGALPCVSSFAAFLTRAADQLRMTGLSGHHMIVAGSHAGISIGEDGPSQMGLEDLALFRAINGATVCSPSDAVSCYHLLPAAMAAGGLVYLRLCRPTRPLIYDLEDRDFRLGGSRLLRSGEDDRLTVVAHGICVHEALAAAERLAADGIGLRVIDAYSIAPLDVDGIGAAAAVTEHLITVEDHYRAGGLGEAVAARVLPRLDACGFTHLAVDGLPRSGDSAALMARHRIDAEAIVEAAQLALA